MQYKLIEKYQTFAANMNNCIYVSYTLDFINIVVTQPLHSRNINLRHVFPQYNSISLADIGCFIAQKQTNKIEAITRRGGGVHVVHSFTTK